MLYWEDVSNMNHYFFTAENPAEGAAFTYHLARPAQKVRLIVTNAHGKVIREITGPAEAGSDSARELGSPVSGSGGYRSRRRWRWRR